MSNSADTAPFSFHCVICIEPFNLTDRPPVVLPCGHTFICELCSKRIKRCFECRTSLYITRPQHGHGHGHGSGGQNITNGGGGANGSFYHHHHQNNNNQSFNHSLSMDSPATPGSRRAGGYQGHTRYMNNHNGHTTPSKKIQMEQIPLPLPKNHVLLSLMQSAQTRQKATKNSLMAGAGASAGAGDGADSLNILDRHLDTDDEFEEDEDEAYNDLDDDEAVLNSLDELSSACGTYIVKDRYGLPVYSVDDFGGASGAGAGAGISSRNTRARARARTPTLPFDQEHFSPSSSKPTMVLSHGQRIQVVAVEEGMFYLARKSGVVFANSMQLVKVGVAKEQSCRIEGMIHAVQTSKASLSQKLNNLLHAETNLRSKLDYALSHPPDHPVVEESIEEKTKKAEEDFFANATVSASTSTGMMDVEVCSTNSSNSQVHIQMQGQQQHARSPPASGGFLSSSTFPTNTTRHIDGSTQMLSDESIGTPTPATPPPVETPRTRRTLLFDTATPTGHVSEPDSPFRSGLMCGSSIFPLLRRLDDDDDDDVDGRSHIPIRRADSDDFRSHIPIRRADSDDFPSTMFDSVDFRTGMSGHIALNRAHRKYKNVSRGNVRLMGEHRGIAAIKNIRKYRTPSSPIREKEN